ncbi:MAG: lysophospholipase [candidate division NC10 bacterium]|nr:lysophospholipase [candidate division NC10 bacterium]
MRFERLRDLRSSDGHAVPAYLLEPERPAGGIALAHGYGGAKEQMLGLAAHLAEAGFAACCPDLRGHGEHPAPLGPGLLQDLESAVGYCRRYGRVAALGHSLGGRLALMSSADLLIAVSPAIPKRPSDEGRAMLVAFGSTAVRTPDPAAILPLLQALGPVPDSARPKLLLVAEGDVPSLLEGVAEASAALTAAERQVITHQQHRAAPLPETIGAYLPHWFNHTDLKTNPEVAERVQAWLEHRWGAKGI